MLTRDTISITVVEPVGDSEESLEDAAQTALDDANETIPLVGRRLGRDDVAEFPEFDGE